ncbi:MAG: hypothetical protein R3B07_33880, partial [Polyangiaceae bacterium]
GHALVNACAGGLTIVDNIVAGGASQSCVSQVQDLDPGFSDAANANFHTSNSSVASYGAYAN